MNKKYFLFYFLSFCFFLFLYSLIINKQSFGDEQEVITGGWLLTKGFCLYRDQFVPRGPFLYFLAALIQICFGENIFFYRSSLLFFYLMSFMMTTIFLNKKLKIAAFLTLICLGLGGYVFHGHMFLVDNIIAFCILLNLMLVFEFWEKKINIWVMIWISFLNFIAINSSLVAVLPMGILLFSFLIKKTFRYFWVLIIPNLFFPLYFLIKKSFQEYFWTLFKFSHYYFLFRIGEPDEIKLGKFGFFYRVVSNALEHIFLSFKNFFITGFYFLQSCFYFNPLLFYRKVETFGLLSFFRRYYHFCWIVIRELFKNTFSLEMIFFFNFILLIVFLLKTRKYFLGFLFFVLIIGLRVRSNEVFHLAPYYLVSFFCLNFLLSNFLFSKSFFQKYWLIKTFSLISMFFLIINTFKGYRKIVADDSRIIKKEIESTSQLIEKKTSRDDKILLLTGNPVFYMLADRMPASKYYFYFPYFFKIDKIKEEAEIDIKRNMPKLIFISNWEKWEQEDESFRFAKEIIQDIRPLYKREGVFLIKKE